MKSLPIALVEVFGKPRPAYSGYATAFNSQTGQIVVMAVTKAGLQRTLKNLVPNQRFSAKKFKQVLMIEVEHSK